MKRKKQATSNRQSRQCAEEKRFYSSDGSVYASLAELAAGLRKMHPDTYRYHANEQKNDFHNWIKDVFSDKTLAREALEARNQVHLARMIDSKAKERR